MRSLLLSTVCLAALATGCGVELEHGLDERQANQITAILDEHGVGADKQRDDSPTGESWKIVVPQKDRSRAYQLLESYDLPKRGRRGVDDLLAERGLLPSMGEEHTRLESARGAELERTLERIPGVVCARVHLALPDPGRLDGVTAPPRASVLLRTQGAVALSEAQVRTLVMGATAGMEREAVQVIITGGESLPAATPTETVGPVSVARGERGRVVAIAASGLTLLVLLGAALVLTALRLSALRTRTRETTQSASNRNG